MANSNKRTGLSKRLVEDLVETAGHRRNEYNLTGREARQILDELGILWEPEPEPEPPREPRKLWGKR